MTLQKRGLGRGLEVLLADSSALGGLQQESLAIEKIEEQAVMPQTQIEKIQREHAQLLGEVEALKSLLNEFELIVRSELQ